MSKLLKRREFIQRMGLTTGSILLNPILDTLIGEAWGQVSNKKRLVIYMSGGHMPEQWTGTGGSNPNFTLPYIFSPLDPFKKDMIVMRNLYNTVYRNLHGNLYGTLSGYPAIGVPAGDNFAYLNARPGGPSFDTVMSDELGAGTRHKEMVIGYTRPSQTGLAYGYDKVKPTVMNLTDAFNTYISGPLPGVDNQRAAKLQKSVLDFAVGDIRKAYRGLASPEKGKFEQFLASVEEIQKSISISNTSSSTCSTGYQLPSGGVGLDGKSYPIVPTYNNLPNLPWWQGGNGFVGNNYVHADMAALALGCGVTRHVTFVSAYHEAHQFYPDIGAPVDVHEDICHQLERTSYRDAVAVERAQNIIKYHASVVGKMYDKLKKTPEGNGTAADNTVILWFCDVGGQHHYGHYGYTAILLGNAGGALRSGNSYTFGTGEWREGSSQYSMSQLYYTIAKAIGSSVKQVGDGSNVGNSVIPGILA